MIKLLQIKVQNKTLFFLKYLEIFQEFSDFTVALPSVLIFIIFLCPNLSLICKLTVVMCTYCCCTEYFYFCKFGLSVSTNSSGIF
jgi:hypothetical protein